MNLKSKKKSDSEIAHLFFFGAGSPKSGRIVVVGLGAGNTLKCGPHILEEKRGCVGGFYISTRNINIKIERKVLVLGQAGTDITVY